ncbi:type IX secretion system sortase PorU [Membranicola marinus]|uniref:Type IX secretion system sortase PorU n=1 Tax=Membranihabitans marinus TaxID=1227546 RepID=A0A953HTE8_9BACT|nr:type IX secretion system sortase PorU [Membranihabitans marinus]MBY5957891.1 type IX secretion system sortase PorU [Membranihabitans marinus]
MRIFYIIAIMGFAAGFAYGQSTLSIDLTWKENRGEQLVLMNEGHDSGNLPVIFRRVPIGSGDSLRVELVARQEKRFANYQAPGDLSADYRIVTYTETEKDQQYGTIYLYPIRKNSHSDVTVLESGQLKITIIPGKPAIRTRRVDFTNKSALSEGQVVRFPILESTVYRIDYEQLPDAWTSQNFSPERIQLFAGHPGPLPYGVDDPKIDDLQEVPYYLDGEMTRQGDGMVFYAVGSHRKEVSEEPGFLTIQHNVYADTNYYYLRYGEENGRQIDPPPPLTAKPAAAVSKGADVWRYEEDNYNILESIIQGSGRTWYTEAFTGSTSRDYSAMVGALPIDQDREVLFSAAFAGRSDFQNTITFEVGDQKYSKSVGPVQMADRYGVAARIATFQKNLSLDPIHLSLRHQTQQGNSRGWLDYLELAYTKPLKYENVPLEFHDFSGAEAFQVTQASQGLLAFQITNPFEISVVPALHENSSFFFEGGNPVIGTPQHFVVFNPKQAAKVSSIKKVDPQNLHGIQSVDYLIVYHPRFRQEVQQLANHRQQHNGFKVEMVNILDIYQEFSSGKTDPSALRNFLKMLYDRGNKDIRVLLFGDGSFDYKLAKNANYADENFIPVFETENSLNPIRAFPSDDYYALLDDREGGDLKGALDISIGRIPVRTASEAAIMVQKILAYDTDPRRYGEWRKEMLMVADDGNYNLFLGYTERLSANIEQTVPPFQINKAYVDATQKQITPNGTLSPKTNAIINNSAYEGQLIINYQGHGNSRGWADEAILAKADLEKWNNFQKYPVLVTATCTFAGYDDPREVTAGEYSLVLPGKGAIALFSTTRVVYANSNDRLTTSLFNRLMERIDTPPELGEWIRLAKNAHRSDTLDINSRKFTLLGDPALKIGIPEYEAVITAINGKDPASADSIRLGALEKVTVSGHIQNRQGQIQDNFYGELAPTLYDKKKSLQTLGQGNDNYPERFEVWRNVIFKGRASVDRGRFEFEFIVPRDIDYTIGPGRMSLYADDGMNSDAWGAGDSILIGGSADQPIENDHQGPAIDVFLGDKNFVSGDEVEPNALLLLDIEDPSGINVSGNGIGHDLIYYLDDQLESETVLNNYFKYDLNSYSKGSVEFPLDNLEPGKHTLTIKVWDSYNNLSEKTVEFYVNKKELAIEHVLNYPNPFFDRTEFQFENPLIGADLKIVIDIFTPSGRLVHRIIENRNSTGQMVRGIYWDGTDQWAQKLANGVYIYKIKIVEQSGNKPTQLDSDFQKLLLLN